MTAHRRENTGDHRHDPSDLVSVGELAEATGIAPATLRVWERRYGYPIPVRLPSGHRRYPVAQIHRLRRIAEAMARGHRIGALLRAPEAEVDRLLDATRPGASAGESVARWLDLVCGLRDAELREGLRAAASNRGVPAFLETDVAPLLRAIGEEWADGRMEVRHEHLASRVVEDVLVSLREREGARPPAAVAGPFVLATLPGERHGLGLHMTALVCESAGIRARLLGVDAPLSEIALAAMESAARGVGISVSLAGGGVETDRLLGELRGILPPSIALVAGGEGARRPRRGPRGVTYFEGLADFDRWLRARGRGGEPAAAPPKRRR